MELDGIGWYWESPKALHVLSRLLGRGVFFPKTYTPRVIFGCQNFKKLETREKISNQFKNKFKNM